MKGLLLMAGAVVAWLVGSIVVAALVEMSGGWDSDDITGGDDGAQ